MTFWPLSALLLLCCCQFGIGTLVPRHIAKRFVVQGTCLATTGSAFDGVYNRGVWGQSLELQSPSFFYTYGIPARLLRASSSGPGSVIGPATARSLEFLSEIVRQFNITSMLDAPCGDVNWQFQSWELDSLAVYVGLDIVRSVVELDQQRFWVHTNKLFLHWDLARCALPHYRMQGERATHPFDMIHMRDVIQHLPLASGKAVIENVRRSGARWLVANTYETQPHNNDVYEGGWYPANLGVAPFDLEPTRCIDTHPDHEADKTCLYAL
jgi:hypothetical protein